MTWQVLIVFGLLAATFALMVRKTPAEAVKVFSNDAAITVGVVVAHDDPASTERLATASAVFRKTLRR